MIFHEKRMINLKHFIATYRTVLSSSEKCKCCSWFLTCFNFIKSNYLVMNEQNPNFLFHHCCLPLVYKWAFKLDSLNHFHLRIWHTHSESSDSLRLVFIPFQLCWGQGCLCPGQGHWREERDLRGSSTSCQVPQKW